MKSGGRAVFILGGVLVAIMLIWGAVGFYVSAVPVMLLLGGAGVALMAVGSKMNKDKEPNKAVQWQPSVIRETPIYETPIYETPLGETPHLSDAPFDFVPWALVGRNGARYQLASSTIVGREPGEAVHAIAVTDSDSSLSKVHALVTVVGDVVRVRDMGSTNGTVVITPEGIEIECEQDEDTVVSAGSTLVLGNCALALANISTEET